MHPTLLRVITDSTIEPPVRLLFSALYAHTNGTGKAAIPEAELLAGLEITPGTLRKYRARLAALGLAVTSCANGVLAVTIPDSVFVPVESAPVVRAEDAERAPQARSEPANAHPMRAVDNSARTTGAVDESARAPQARNAHPMRETRTTGALDRATDRLIDRSSPSHSEEIDQPVGAPAGEAQRTLALLMDPEVGVSEIAARKIAGRYGFWHVLLQVFTWRHGVAAGKALAPGAIVHRIDSGWRPDDLRPDDRGTELFRRHAADIDERRQVADRRRRYAAAAPPASDDQALRLKRYGTGG